MQYFILFQPEFKLPEGTSLEVVKHFFNRLQQAYSPLKKLENLLAAISTIYNSVSKLYLKYIGYFIKIFLGVKSDSILILQRYFI